MDAIVRKQGDRTQYVTSGGDDYVVDHNENKVSGILSSEEERMIESGDLTLDEIDCDDEL